MKSKILKSLAALVCIGTVGVAYATTCYYGVGHWFAEQGETRVLGATYSCPDPYNTTATITGSGTFVMVCWQDCSVGDYRTPATQTGYDWYWPEYHDTTCYWTYAVSCNAQTQWHEQPVHYPSIDPTQQDCPL